MEKIDLRARLGESQAKLVEQEKLAALGAVLAWLSHRMRNSLSVILMCAHYLQKKVVPSASDNELGEVLTAIIEKVKTLEKITSDLIGYSRRYELQKNSENLNAIIEDVVNSLLVQIQIRKVNLVKQLDPNLPQVACDPHILHEAFENIIVNALQAIGAQENESMIVESKAVSEAELPWFSQKDYASNGKGDWVLLSIANTGSLISPENREKVFMPFFTTKEDGSGLGLAIVKKIVEEHGGVVFAESWEKDGKERTAFKIFFPCAAMPVGG
jgi:signal transduction histidine kinase